MEERMVEVVAVVVGLHQHSRAGYHLRTEASARAPDTPSSAATSIEASHPKSNVGDLEAGVRTTRVLMNPRPGERPSIRPISLALR
jgi:hypothetical protein